jgi:diadenosine tetraphosphatase ApaH/serine/threonine PP2A family protein phosphatase
MDRIRALPELTCMMGNHDYAAVGNMPLEIFNIDAKKALLWQREKLTDVNREFLRTLLQTPKVCGSVTLAHGSPRDPIWEYIMNTLVARANLDFFETSWCLVGHSHFQTVFQYHEETDEMSIQVPGPGARYELKERAILNPGSVGQPRDRDPRAAYAFYYPDVKIWEPRRVEYDIKSVQKRILDAGLPPRHAERLAGGW